MREKRIRTKFTLGRFESGTDVVDHELVAEPEAYGAALRTSPEAQARIQAFVARKRGG